MYLDIKFVRDALGWGAVLWVFGFLLSIPLFIVLPEWLLGWVIMPFGLALTAWVLLTKVEVGPLSRYLLVAIAWTALAVALDYVFIVGLLGAGSSYYRIDVLLYYALTFGMPLLIGRLANPSQR